MIVFHLLLLYHSHAVRAVPLNYAWQSEGGSIVSCHVQVSPLSHSSSRLVGSLFKDNVDNKPPVEMSLYARRLLWLADDGSRLTDAHTSLCLKELVTVLIQCATSDSTGQLKSASTNSAAVVSLMQAALCGPGGLSAKCTTRKFECRGGKFFKKKWGFSSRRTHVYASPSKFNTRQA